VPYPGFQTPGGFVASAAIIVVLVVGLYVMFRRKDWL
jgi:magnesium transporter